MAETPEKNPAPTEQAYVARILDAEDDPSMPGTVRLEIDADTRGKDVIATLRFLRPKTDRLQMAVDGLLSYAIESRGANRVIELPDPIGRLSDQVTFERRIKLGDKPTYNEFLLGLELAGLSLRVEDPEQTLAISSRMLELLVDQGFLADTTSFVPQENEMLSAADGDIGEEWERLMRGDGS